MPHIEFDAIVRTVPECPVCGSTDREAFTAPQGSISPYTRTIAETVGMDPTALLEKLPLWTCRSCTSNWHDPWFTVEFADTFYSYVCGQHFYGWTGLAHWLRQQPAPFVATRSAIWQFLHDNLAGPLTYAELNCPNAGLSFAELDARNGPESRKQGVARLRELTRVYSKASVFDRPAAAAAALNARAGHAPVEGLLINRTLLKEDSPYCWGRSCVQRGVGCHAYAQDFMFDRIITLKQAEESGEHFDIVGTFVTLDHTPDPIAMMKRLLKIGTRVLLEMHPPGWTDVQHFYALGDGFTKSFEQAGIHLRDLTTWSRAHGVPGPSNGSRFYILSVDDDLSWVPESPQA